MAATNSRTAAARSWSPPIGSGGRALWPTDSRGPGFSVSAISPSQGEQFARAHYACASLGLARHSPKKSPAPGGIPSNALMPKQAAQAPVAGFRELNRDTNPRGWAAPVCKRQTCLRCAPAGGGCLRSGDRRVPEGSCAGPPAGDATAVLLIVGPKAAPQRGLPVKDHDVMRQGEQRQPVNGDQGRAVKEGDAAKEQRGAR